MRSIKKDKKIIEAYLPSFFSFNQAKDLVRVGRENDGGYLVSQSDIERSDILISFGISDDWSFESDFNKYYNTKVIAYDASLNFNFLLKRGIFQTLKKPFSFWLLKKIISYKKFFKGKNKHIQKFIGLSTPDENYCTFLEVINEIYNKNIYLKIDIEGSEYRFLDDIVTNQEKITGLVIELHDCDINLDKIEKFVKELNRCGLNLIHIHANNFSPIRLEDSLPTVLELTFSKYAKLLNNFILPHKLDMPNNKNAPEYKLLIND